MHDKSLHVVLQVGECNLILLPMLGEARCPHDDKALHKVVHIVDVDDPFHWEEELVAEDPEGARSPNRIDQESYHLPRVLAHRIGILDRVVEAEAVPLLYGLFLLLKWILVVRGDPIVELEVRFLLKFRQCD